MKILQTKDKKFQEKLKLFLERNDETGSSSVITQVQKIIDDVRRRGDKAVLEMTRKWDQFALKASLMEVTEDEITAAYKKADASILESLKVAATRIEKFHQTQLKNSFHSWSVKEDGITLGEKVTPLDRIGIYVPGGLAAYPSTVLMNAIPALVAGVEKIIMVSPWNQGQVNPYTLIAAHMSGVHRIFKVGGAQAIAALAYGTQTIPCVDKIVGPGNLYVATAKQLVFGHVGIDMIAGPTEVVVIADETADPLAVATDLLSQAEHDPRAVPILITPSEALIKEAQEILRGLAQKAARREIIQKSITSRGLIIHVRDTFEAIEISNQIAPEHLEIQIQNHAAALKKIKHAGAVFLGSYTPVACGDYLAGPNHVLPTSRTARFSSPLSVYDFLKRSSLIEFDKKSLQKLGPHVAQLARTEGLDGHAESIEVRLKEPV